MQVGSLPSCSEMYAESLIKLADIATNQWNKDAGTLLNDAWPLQLAFHAYDPVLAVTDDADNICIWDWKAKVKVNKFSNQNITGSSISSVHFINEMASSLILTASSESARTFILPVLDC